MKQKFEFYKHVDNDIEISELKNLFEANDILYEVSSASQILDHNIVGHREFAKYTLKLLKDDFQKASLLIKKEAESKNLNIEDFEHLTLMSDSELYNILTKPEEWSIESEIVAKKILKSHNVTIPEDEIEQIKQDNFNEKNKGKKVAITTQVLYFLAMIAGAYISLFFTIAGISMAYYYSFGKTTGQDGKTYFVYDAQARATGKFMLYFGTFVLICQIYWIFSQIITD